MTDPHLGAETETYSDKCALEINDSIGFIFQKKKKNLKEKSNHSVPRNRIKNTLKHFRGYTFKSE